MDYPAYRHRPHAANLSDILKHLCLSCLRHQPGLETLWDAFAAEPHTPYSQLAGREALLRAVLSMSGPPLVAEFQQQLRDARDKGPVYPGSASILADFDSVQTLWLSDHDPDCCARLSQVFSHYHRPRVSVLCMDSVRAAVSVLRQRPDMVFIDPPFLQQQEWQGGLSLLRQVHRARAATHVVLWYPIRAGFSVPAAVQQLPAWRMRFDYDASQDLQGCAVLMVNFDTQLQVLLGSLADALNTSGLPGLRAAHCEWQD